MAEIINYLKSIQVEFMVGGILKFFNENIDALTAIGIILTFLVSIISLYFSVKNNKAVHYVNTITSSRIEWINQLRDLASEYIKVCSVEHIMSVWLVFFVGMLELIIFVFWQIKK